VIFVGVDWAEDHHDVCVMDLEGTVLGKRRVPDSISGHVLLQRSPRRLRCEVRCRRCQGARRSRAH